jgi:hypothetical protein
VAISFYPEGNTVLSQDGELRTLHKIADCSCTGGNATVIYNNSDPDTPGGDIYILYVKWNSECNALWLWVPPADAPPSGMWTEFDFDKATGSYRVPTVVELRAIPTLDCPPVDAVTFGNLVPRDGQGAHYQFDNDAYDADDGMSVIMPNDRTIADAGRWMQFSPA